MGSLKITSLNLPFFLGFANLLVRKQAEGRNSFVHSHIGLIAEWGMWQSWCGSMPITIISVLSSHTAFQKSTHSIWVIWVNGLLKCLSRRMWGCPDLKVRNLGCIARETRDLWKLRVKIKCCGKPYLHQLISTYPLCGRWYIIAGVNSGVRFGCEFLLHLAFSSYLPLLCLRFFI